MVVSNVTYTQHADLVADTLLVSGGSWAQNAMLTVLDGSLPLAGVSFTQGAPMVLDDVTMDGGSWTLHQEGTYAIDADHRWMAASAMDQEGNLALGYSLPNDARFIVAGMGLDYVKKARGTITGECHILPIDSNAKHEYQINVTLRDESGDVVVEGTLRTLVGPKQRQ